ncbi:hypothetical protein B0T21DRAFT_45495 [Apiosordaria backusii]|uniref:Uncharacterized protein n=1 Tax=Apiosordaria backusii TaxID=314023 RepID=A0AA40E645_9PEZI|nr:hypothetical protein B0T21DRAFT_45495 [Apiosordaria backusii]
MRYLQETRTGRGNSRRGPTPVNKISAGNADWTSEFEGILDMDPPRSTRYQEMQTGRGNSRHGPTPVKRFCRCLQSCISRRPQFCSCMSRRLQVITHFSAASTGDPPASTFPEDISDWALRENRSQRLCRDPLMHRVYQSRTREASGFSAIFQQTSNIELLQRVPTDSQTCMMPTQWLEKSALWCQERPPTYPTPIHSLPSSVLEKERTSKARQLCFDRLLLEEVDSRCLYASRHSWKLPPTGIDLSTGCTKSSPAVTFSPCTRWGRNLLIPCHPSPVATLASNRHNRQRTACPKRRCASINQLQRTHLSCIMIPRTAER